MLYCRDKLFFSIIMLFLFVFLAPKLGNVFSLSYSGFLLYLIISQVHTVYMYSPLQVPLVPPDVSHEETVFRIINATEQLMKLTSDIFKRLESRAQAIEGKLVIASEHANAVSMKVDGLKQDNRSLFVVAPSRLPTEDATLQETIFSSNETCSMSSRQLFVPTSCAFDLDMKRALQEKKQFFLPSQLVRRANHNERTVSRYPSDCGFVDIFYHDSDVIAYEGENDSWVRRRQNSDTTSKTVNFSSSFGASDNAASALRSWPTSEDPLAYRPDSRPFEEFDLPNVLPNLPGVAEDISFFDGIPPPEKFDLPQFAEKEPNAVVDQRQLKFEVESSTTGPLSTQTCVNVPPLVSLPAPPPSLPVAVSLTAVPPPPHPPPPPPPPPAISQHSTITIAAPHNDRATLMDAIRRAGGASKAALRKVDRNADEQRRHVRKRSDTNKSIGPSALPTNGGDLMSALAKALDARRKYISGKREKEFERDLSSSDALRVPSPPGDATDSGDDWR